MISALARIEGRQLARGPLLGLGVALGAAGMALEMSWFVPALAGDDLLAYRNGGFMLGGAAVLAGAWLGLRDRTTGAADLVAATPTDPRWLCVARLAGVAAAAAGGFALLFGVALAVSAARGGRGLPDLRLLADGALAVVIGGWVGLAVGRLSGSRILSVLAAPLWASLYVVVGQATWSALPVQYLSPVLNLYNRSAAYGFLPDPLWPHLGWLLGLALLVGALPLALAPPDGGRRLPPWPLLAVAAAALVLAGGAGARLLALPDVLLVLGPDRASWQAVTDEFTGGAWELEHPGWSFPADNRARACAGDATLTACVYPAYGQRLARDIHDAVAPVAGMFAGLPDVPTRVRMVPVGNGACGDGEVQVSEQWAREPSTRSDSDIRDLHISHYLGCALGPANGDHPTDEAREAVTHWALLASGTTTRELLEQERDAPAGPEHRRVAAAALAMAELPPDRVRAELAPVWKRLRAGTLPVAELPGQRP